jgi:hypothetical protein
MNNLSLPFDKAVSPITWSGEVSSAQFRERAKHYRFAAVMSDDFGKRQMFHDLAFMFEQMACDFTRLETHKSRPPAARQR